MDRGEASTSTRGAQLAAFGESGPPAGPAEPGSSASCQPGSGTLRERDNEGCSAATAPAAGHGGPGEPDIPTSSPRPPGCSGSTSPWRASVIGAGVGGMAQRRAAPSRDTTRILSAAPGYGGKLGWFRRDGFVFDTGPSFRSRCRAVYRDLLSRPAGRSSTTRRPAGGRASLRLHLVPTAPGLSCPAADRAGRDGAGGRAGRAQRGRLAQPDAGARTFMTDPPPVLEAPGRYGTWHRWSAALSDLRTVAPGRACAAWAGPCCATSGPSPARPLRHLHRVGPRRAPAALVTVPRRGTDLRGMAPGRRVHADPTPWASLRRARDRHPTRLRGDGRRHRWRQGHRRHHRRRRPPGGHSGGQRRRHCPV